MSKRSKNNASRVADISLCFVEEYPQEMCGQVVQCFVIVGELDSKPRRFRPLSGVSDLAGNVTFAL